ncbi:MAG: SAM-dependent methyltransferase [Phycisphaerae bacterium]|jgi:hypothetical protein
MKTDGISPSSFRDPSGFIFYRDGSIYRQINTAYKENYDHLMDSGLYDSLVKSGVLIPHEQVDIAPEESSDAYKVIKPQPITFISYPYEWCFSQLKNAALTTLEIQKKALDFGMSLKDCSAYNIQFAHGRPVFIDTLSFKKYLQGHPWVAYRQFCRHFLAPLALMSYKDIGLSRLFRIYMDGVPLDVASSLLPNRTWLKLSLLSHIHLHAKSKKYYADKVVDTNKYKLTQFSFRSVIDNLESAIKGLNWQPEHTEWADYYEDTNYSAAALEHKKKLVAEFLDKINPKSVWDLGANDGLFSRIASDRAITTISFDIDPAAVEKNYLKCIEKNESNILPLLLDLTNPSPGIGWQNEERLSLQQRGPADTVFALALIHHLAISNNLPFNKIADFFGKICSSLIVEFVPKTDSQVQRLLSTRKDIFPNYKQQVFESVFSRYFTIQSSAKIRDSERTLYLMRRKGAEA